MPYGLTDQGYNPKTLDQIVNEKKTEIINKVNGAANVSDESVFGQLINISGEREVLIWELIQKLFDNGSPATATKVALDYIVAFNNISRKPATKAKVETQAFLGTVGQVISAGTNISVSGNPESVFSTDEEVTLVAGANEVQTFTYSATATTGTATYAYNGVEFPIPFGYDSTSIENQIIASVDDITDVSVTGSGSTGFVVTFQGVDGLKPHNLITLVSSTLKDAGSLNVLIGITRTTTGQYQGSCSATALVAGSSYVANEGTLTVFETSVPAGITTYNEEAAVLGTDVETDNELKLRRANSVGIGGGCTLDSVVSEINTLEDVSTSFAVENDTDVTDVAGRPAGSMEVYVYQNNGATDSAVDYQVAEIIWKNKPVGTRTWSSATNPSPEYVEVNYIDSTGITRVVNFSRPETLYIWLELDLTVDLTKFTSVTAAALVSKIVTWGNALGPGTDVVVYPYLINLLSEYEGILDVVTRIAGDASDTVDPNPTLDDNVTIDDGTSGTVQVSEWKSNLISITLNGSPV